MRVPRLPSRRSRGTRMPTASSRCAAVRPCRQLGERAGLEMDAVARAMRVDCLQVLRRDPDDEDVEAAPEMLALTRTPRPQTAADGWNASPATAPGGCRLIVAPLDEPPPGNYECVWRGRPGRKRPTTSDRCWTTPCCRICVAGRCRCGAPHFEAAPETGPPRGRRNRGRASRVFDFEGLTESLPAAVTWLKQAVRFARRK